MLRRPRHPGPAQPPSEPMAHAKPSRWTHLPAAILSTAGRFIVYGVRESLGGTVTALLVMGALLVPVWILLALIKAATWVWSRLFPHYPCGAPLRAGNARG